MRVVAATNVDLTSWVESGRFRKDLYFRLVRYPLRLPALRERRDDIPLLAQHFLQSFAEETGGSAQDLQPEVLQILQQYDYPGNVRELRTAMERALLESDGGIIGPQHVHLGFAPVIPVASRPLVQSAVAVEDLPLDFAEAARLMGINRTRIYHRLAQVEGDSTADDEGTANE